MNRNIGVPVLLFTLITLVTVGCGSGGAQSAVNVDATVAARVQAANVESTIEARVQATLAANGKPSTPQPQITAAPTPTPVPSPIAQLGIGSKQVSDKDGMTLLYVPAGEFTMGSNEEIPLGILPEGQLSDLFAVQAGDMMGNPEHTVYLDAFWIDQTEVTSAMYAKCVTAGVCQAPPLYGFEDPKFDTYPMQFVAWNDAKTYCDWAGRHLPTEAQWEKAARGTDGRLYPWGNQPPDKTRLNYSGEVGHATQVGAYPAGASPYGALDMAGSVYEWVADWYGEKYYVSSPDRNPAGPSSGNARVNRNGPWNSKVPPRVYIRSWSHPDVRSSSPVTYGFRCAR